MARFPLPALPLATPHQLRRGDATTRDAPDEQRDDARGAQLAELAACSGQWLGWMGFALPAPRPHDHQ